MTTANFTRSNLETTSAQIAADLLAVLARAENMHARVSAELAAGTLDGADFYQGDAAGKGNVVGLYDDLHAINGDVQALRGHIDHFIGF